MPNRKRPFDLSDAHLRWAEQEHTVLERLRNEHAEAHKSLHVDRTKVIYWRGNVKAYETTPGPPLTHATAALDRVTREFNHAVEDQRLTRARDLYDAVDRIGPAAPWAEWSAKADAKRLAAEARVAACLELLAEAEKPCLQLRRKAAIVLSAHTGPDAIAIGRQALRAAARYDGLRAALVQAQAAHFAWKVRMHPIWQIAGLLGQAVALREHLMTRFVDRPSPPENPNAQK